MKNELITALETFGYPVNLQGSLAEDSPYPDSFFTFWNADTADQNHYNNKAIAYIWTFDVNFYSVDPVLVNTILLEAKQLLISQGWIISGKGRDITSDEKTHTGRGFTAVYLEFEEV